MKTEEEQHTKIDVAEAVVPGATTPADDTFVEAPLFQALLQCINADVQLLARFGFSQMPVFLQQEARQP